MPRKAKKITLPAKNIIDRELALALEDYEKGRFIGLFRTAKAAVRALRHAIRG